jgi:hypothetical protein
VTRPLFVFGYAAGALLQALSQALIESPWLWIRGGQPTATLLMPDPKKLSDDAKLHALVAIRAAHRELSMGEKDKGYRKLLEDRTYRAWKTVALADPQVQLLSGGARHTSLPLENTNGVGLRFRVLLSDDNAAKLEVTRA